MSIKTIYLADSENIFIDCLATTLKLEQEFEIVGRNSNGAIAYNEIRSIPPDLLITDLNLASLSGINLIRKIKAVELSTKVILLSSDISPTAIHKALSAGVDGIILKSDHYSLLIEAISVISHRKFLSPGTSDPLVNNFLNFSENPNQQKISPLSDREEQVAKLIGDGISSRDIATTLSISEKTVSKHRSNIFKKLNIKNTAQLVRYVYDNNLVG
ncbi:MAG: response regulator transcription factor [Gammaproteobacteria bacterium]|nr:response regulator transcription factor [Gammaproteobacteria bacterium]